MTARLIDGAALASRLRARIADEVKAHYEKSHQRPGLATVLIGQDPASASYIKSKRKACAELGIESFGYDLPETVTPSEIERLVARLNADPHVHGVLVQLPLPAHLPEHQILHAVSVDKDVDGFHPANIGHLAMKGHAPMHVPCTPAGCMALLEEAGAQFESARAVVVGRSNLVGMPVSLLLQRRNATVTVAHSHTQNLPELCQTADILVVAVGQAQMVKRSWVKPGAIVIDVGINQIEDASKKSGYRLVGDVDFDEVKEVAAAITPVPGGVGPMTIAMLMQNTLTSAKQAWGIG
jgi:methylenetetrahydrofolate dehydrogenase (NADP+) / methenyltetrahydrofolate cyclohydrolase